MQLLYARSISRHMAFDIRDEVLQSVLKSSLSSTTKDWFTKTFGSDEGMRVSVLFLTQFL
jgi:hypothetical protein